MFFLRKLCSALGTLKAAGTNGLDEPSSEPLPFQMLATAYRRKKMMEAVMDGDNDSRKRLSLKIAEDAERRKFDLAGNVATSWKVKKHTDMP